MLIRGGQTILDDLKRFCCADGFRPVFLKCRPSLSPPKSVDAQGCSDPVCKRVTPKWLCSITFGIGIYLVCDENGEVASTCQ